MENHSKKTEQYPKINTKTLLKLTIPFLLFGTILISIQLSKNLRFKKPPNPTTNLSYHGSNEIIRNPITSKTCDLFSGKWVPNPEGPYYTNDTCRVIEEHFDCMMYKRPDNEFMKWKWKPNDCDLPIFNAKEFFKIVEGKSLVFLGDSVGRNHMQSLICLLSQVESPKDVSQTKDENFRRWYFETHNFTVATLWSPFLVKSQYNDPHNKTGKTFYGLYLDEPNDVWTAQINDFNYVIISAGHWFFKPLIYYKNRQIIGCRFCEIDDLTEYSLAFGYHNAFHTTFRAILEKENFKGTVFMRTFAPAHYEHGDWDTGGDCLRKGPYNISEVNLEGAPLDLYNAQMDAFKEAQRLADQRGIKFHLLDMTRLMLMRPDGHPSTYTIVPARYINGVWRVSDCVHWCVPGPIDSWNDFLLELLKIEG